MTNVTDLTEEICIKIKPVKRFIYLIHMTNTNYYKVGISDNTDLRLIALQTFNPFELKIVYSKEFEDAEPVEAYLLNFFVKHRVRGEWFEFVQNDVFDILHFLQTLEYSNDLKKEIRKKLRFQKMYKEKVKIATQKGLVRHTLRLMPSYPTPKIWTSKKTGDTMIWFHWKIPGTNRSKRFSFKYGLNYEKNLERRLLKAEVIKKRLIRLFETGLSPLEHLDDFKKIAY